MSKKIVLFSGGIDSYAAWYYLGKPQTVYFPVGTPSTKMETKIIRELIPETIIDNSIHLANREESEGGNAFLPMRNLYFAMLACKYGDEIVMAGLKDDVVNDKNEEIFAEFSSLLSRLNNRVIKVTSPFWDETKAEVVSWYLGVKGSLSGLLRTVSCYSSGEEMVTDYFPYDRYCGECRCCFRKWCAFWANGIHMHFFNDELLGEYYARATQGKYVASRNETIKKAVSEYRLLMQADDNNFSDLKERTVAVDIDGVLTKETGGHDYEYRTSVFGAIKKVNALVFSGYKVVLFSSRYEQDREVTLQWLEQNNVLFHELILGKPQYNYMVDDRSANLYELKTL